MNDQGWYYILLLVWTVGTICVQSRPCSAQNNRFTQRSFISSAEVLGMGDAGVALRGTERGYFYNSAHLPSTSSHFTIFGVQGSSTRSLEDHISYFTDRVEPAIQSDFDLSESALADLHREATALAARPGRGVGTLLLPSFVYSTGSLGVGGGMWAKTALNYRIESPGGRVPSVWLLSRTDLMAVAGVGIDLDLLGMSDLSVGVTARQTRRLLAFKQKPLDRLNVDETAVFLEGGVFQVDVGTTYEPGWWHPLPGTLRVGGALYDVLRNDYTYTSGGAGRMPFLSEVVGTSGDSSAAPSDREIEQARRLFSLESSYRIGIAYEISPLYFLDEVGVALDYQGYGTSDQTHLARLHGGIRAQVYDGVHVRGGLSSGYPSGGLGLELGALYLEYAIHGVEEGRQAGQLGVYMHTARVLFRLE